MSEVIDTYALENFPELMLGMKSVPAKHKEVLAALGVRGSRIAVQASNGVGKTSCIEVSAILWHMVRFKGSPVVCTAGAFRQVAEALWPHLREKSNGLGGEAVGWHVTDDKITFTHKDGLISKCICYAVTDPNKAEGHHASGPDQNLLYVIDEAKGVADGIFDAMERCQPTRVLVMSSPGAPEGRFYKICKGQYGFKVFKIQASDCPWITKEWIAQQIEMHGEKSPLVQSMIYAEFVEEEGGLKVLPLSVLNMALDNKVKPLKGNRSAGLDFAAGGDSNVLSIRNGNATEKRVRWKDKDTMRAVGRFITEIKLAGLEGSDCWADSGGMGIPMCDALRDAGIVVNRVNNGEAAFDKENYANRGTEMWVRYARMIEIGKIVPPDDEEAKSQLTARGMDYNSKGKLQLESKDKMKERGVSSPDTADADILSFMGGGEFALAGQQHAFDRPNYHEQLDEAIDTLRNGGHSLPGCSFA